MKLLMNAGQIQDAIEGIKNKIISHLETESVDTAKLALVGIRRRGEIIAGRLSGLLEPHLGFRPPVGALDITMYRDDAMRSPLTIPLGTEMNFRLDDRPVILVDDVLFTGRSVRAALDAMVDFGRPRFIRLAVLFDRAGREYPIAADFTGRNIDVERDSVIMVQLKPLDDADRVYIARRAPVKGRPS
jgi:pyrimidine operon attenuation protein/uracil phosphoribosyltransferase